MSDVDADLISSPLKRPKLNKNVKFPERHILGHYEKNLTTALIKNAPRSLLILVEKAHGNGLISGELRVQLESLDPNVPYPLMCRYLLLHVHKNIVSQDNLMHWLDLLSTVEVPTCSNVLSLVRQHYDSLLSIIGEGINRKEVFLKEFEAPVLTEILAGHSSKWEVIAISLGLPDNEIKNIAANKPDEVALNEVLLSWVGGGFEHAKDPTLGNLQKALRSNIVGLNDLANNLKLDDNCLLCSKLKDDSDEFRIVNQTKEVDVSEGKYALLEVQSNHEAICQWSYDDFGSHPNVFRSPSAVVFGSFSHCSDFFQNGNIKCIFAGDITTEGYYMCKIHTEGDMKYLYTEPISVTVHTPIDQYKSFLVDRYISSPELPSEWPPASTNSFINLALIKQESIHKAGKYGRCTIRGDMDDIFKDKESITYDKAFGGLSRGEILLIEGRPGSGKTTLVHKFSQDWARKEITITHVRLLFLIHLRGFCSDPNIGLCDLIRCYFSSSDVEVIEKYANKHHGLGLCFVLDGLDEYMPQRKNAFIYELMRKRVLPKSVVIVASRPAAAANFRKEATRQIEVLGFLKDQIYDYIENYPFSSPSKSHAGLIKYLDEHPNVLHMCYLPIHTCMVCFLYDNLESDLPQTETSIYAEFTKSTMLRMLYRDDSNSDMCIESLNDLPQPQNQLYVTICKLAFEMTSSSKQVMKQTEVKHFFNLQPTDKDFMGLITIDKMALICGFQKLYTFLHLTFQEFLAAFYITSLDEEKQLELIEQFGDATQIKQVWKFYCGLVPFNGTNSTVIRLIDQSCHGTAFKVQCSFESQQPCTCDSVVDNNGLVYKDYFFTSSDFTAMAYVISNTQHQCVNKVVFDKCTIGMEGVEILAQKACGKLSLITTLCYHGYDCVIEELSVVNRLVHSLPCLEILDVSNTNLGSSEIDALTGSLNHPNLQIVKVGPQDNPLYSSRDLPLLLAKRFSSGCSKLVNVCFSENYRACLPESLPFPFYFYCNVQHINMSFKLRPIELHVLLDDLICSHNCTELYLTGCGIDDNTVSFLADGLKHCKIIRILDLSCNRIGDKGAFSLAKSVKCCLKLVRLNLSLNRISDVGAIAVASAANCTAKVYLCGNYITNTNDILQYINIFIYSLTFSGCTIGDSGVKSLLHFIKLDSKPMSNVQSVCVLDISCNNISCHGAVALSICLKYFPHLEELNVSSNNIGAEGAIAIASSLSGHIHKLSIGNNNISSCGTRAIANALLRHCTMFRELDISLNLMNDDGAIALAEALKHCKKLNILNIGYNNIGNEGANAIADALNHCTHLEELTVCHNNFREDGICAIARSFNHYSQYLHKLDVSYNYIGCEGFKAIATALHPCVNLHEISISNNFMDSDDAKALAEALNGYNLHKLDISHNNIENDGIHAIAAVLNHCSHLEELNVSCNQIGRGGAYVLSNTFSCYAQCLRKLCLSKIENEGCMAIGIMLSHCTHLEELDVSYNRIGDAGAFVLANSFSHYARYLRRLCINNNYIKSEGCKAIATALNHCTHLEELNISYNHIGSVGASFLASTFNHHPLSLHKLDINSNDNIGFEGCIPIAKVLQFCENLRELNLSYISRGNGAIILFAKTLKHCTNLCKLDISYNYIGSAINAIAAALKNFTHLEELNVSYNHIGDEGACSLASSFYRYAQCLRKLNLSNNAIGSEGCKAIAEALEDCVTLKELDLSWNSLEDNDATVLGRALRHCTSLRELDIRSNKIKRDGWMIIADSLNWSFLLKT